MPRPTKLSHSEQYLALRDSAASIKEKNDCAVKAVAAACNVSYEKAHETLAGLGRKYGKATPLEIILDAVEALGYGWKNVSPRSMIEQYPKPHCSALKSVTSHHPDRFPSVWKNGRTYLFLVSGNRHILTVKDGVNCDWTRGQAKRVCGLYEIVRK